MPPTLRPDSQGQRFAVGRCLSRTTAELLTTRLVEPDLLRRKAGLDQTAFSKRVGSKRLDSSRPEIIRYVATESLSNGRYAVVVLSESVVLFAEREGLTSVRSRFNMLHVQGEDLKALNLPRPRTDSISWS